jgi:hypothetical protein
MLRNPMNIKLTKISKHRGLLRTNGQVFSTIKRWNVRKRRENFYYENENKIVQKAH